MRLILLSAAVLLLAGCGGTPAPAPVAPPVRPIAAEPVDRGVLIGLDANALIARFGPPRLTVREGDGTKLQFGGDSCLLDAYLYPAPASSAARVTHIDTRDRDGRGVDQASCVAAIER